MKTKIESKNRTWLQSEALPFLKLGVLLLGLAGILNCPAQTYTILHSFGTNVMGLYPNTLLVQGPDGALYGTTDDGGGFNLGQVFKVNPDGSGYTVLKDFNGADGAKTEAGLVLSGTTLYGTTSEGGTNSVGIVYKLQTDGSGFEVLKEFAGYDGAHPQAGLVLSGTKLYGTTEWGGSNNSGTVFQINTDGTDHLVIHTFAEAASIGIGKTNADGTSPSATLTLSGTTLYGTAAEGGTNGQGTVFKLNVDGSGFTVLKHFSGNDGYYSTASLALSGPTLYGTTQAGGTDGYGVVFKLNTDGSDFTVLKNFNGSDGAYPYAGLLLSGTSLYGTTVEGGSSNYGTVFKLNTEGSDFTAIKNFAEYDGAGPGAGLMMSGTTLYGTTFSGGNNGYGTVFKLETDGSGFAAITHFVGGDGTIPKGELLLSGTTLYGTTWTGGSSGNGIIYKVSTGGSDYVVLKDFTNSSEGAWPDGGLVLSDSTLFGATRFGGPAGNGTVFKLNTNGSDHVLLHAYSARTESGPYSPATNEDGALPTGGLVLSGSTLYGTAREGGTAGNGTVFKVNADGSEYNVLHHFSSIQWPNSPANADGAWPNGELALAGSMLYGTCQMGGSNGWGTVFKVNTDGSEFQVLKHFDYFDGYDPRAGLLLSGETLYGTTYDDSGGGPVGTVFEITKDGSNFAVIKRFNGADGSSPAARLALSGATLFGTTSRGGNSDSGVVFQIKTNGNDFAVLKNFAYADGANPGALQPSGAELYGTTGSGGRLGGGVLFSLSLAPIILVPPLTQTAEAGTTVQFTVVGGGAPALMMYQWFFNGANAISEVTTNSRLVIADLQPGHTGAYTVIVSNAFGAVTSAPVMLNVIAAVERRPVPGINLFGEAGSLLNVDYVNSLNSAPDWLPLDVVSLTSTSQYCFDLAAPLPSERFYRAWQTGTPAALPWLKLNFVPAITLTGDVGNAVRVDGINQFGPTDAWLTLATVTLTNTSQLYFDITAPGQPQRLYRLVPVP
jgi:uncharacterized repeat protein (TIGR03803 family)